MIKVLMKSMQKQQLLKNAISKLYSVKRYKEYPPCELSAFSKEASVHRVLFNHHLTFVEVYDSFPFHLVKLIR